MNTWINGRARTLDRSSRSRPAVRGRRVRNHARATPARAVAGLSSGAAVRGLPRGSRSRRRARRALRREIERACGAARRCGAQADRHPRHPDRAATGRAARSAAPGSFHCMRRRAAPLRRRNAPVRVRLCSTRLGINPPLAGLKTLNRLESVMARGEWRDRAHLGGIAARRRRQYRLRHHVEPVHQKRVVSD